MKYFTRYWLPLALPQGFGVVYSRAWQSRRCWTLGSRSFCGTIQKTKYNCGVFYKDHLLVCLSFVKKNWKLTKETQNKLKFALDAGIFFLTVLQSYSDVKNIHWAVFNNIYVLDVCNEQPHYLGNHKYQIGICYRQILTTIRLRSGSETNKKKTWSGHPYTFVHTNTASKQTSVKDN